MGGGYKWQVINTSADGGRTLAVRSGHKISICRLILRAAAAVKIRENRC